MTEFSCEAFPALLVGFFIFGLAGGIILAFPDFVRKYDKGLTFWFKERKTYFIVLRLFGALSLGGAIILLISIIRFWFFCK